MALGQLVWVWQPVLVRLPTLALVPLRDRERQGVLQLPLAALLPRLQVN
jgi:hypothetical protein